MTARFRWLPPLSHLLQRLRWINITLRGLHLIGIAGVAGGFLFDLPEARWLDYWHLTLATGALLAALYLWTDAGWLRKLKGQAILTKLALLALAYSSPQWRAEIFMLIIALSAVFAHAPDRVRSYAWGRQAQPCKTVTITQDKS